MKAKRIKGFAELENDKPCYYKAIQDGKEVWMFYHPDCGLGNLASHDIIEHEDGTITVSPSILISTKHKGKDISVHGYLEKGIWRDC